VISPLREHIDRLLADVTAQARHFYGDRLVSLVVFGSMGRGTARPDSDLDLLIIADDLPKGRIARVEEFAAVERALTPRLVEGRRAGFPTECSPVFKTPAEVRAGSPLFLDMVEDAKILHDRDGFFARARDGWRDRLARLGARRIWRGNAWLWDLKPDYRPGDIFEL
jgi:predicted nucleotidyltransferase